MTRTQITANATITLAIALAGCGGRSSLGWSGTDGGLADRTSPRFDGGRPDTRAYDVPMSRRDRAIPLPDTWCLPVPAGKVQGTYTGAWTGTWSCSGTATTISGELKLALSPAGAPTAFAVKGTMTGNISYGVPFSGSVGGTMGCSGLQATMPDIVVGSGAMMYKLTGSMQGTFFGGSVPGFSGGWKAYDPATGCSASGSWKASRV
jgi:hypothetical protein